MRDIKEELDKNKTVAMIAPCFVVEFDYSSFIVMLKELGFDKVVELTFGAKLINKEYHNLLKNSKKLMIASVCPGIVETISKSLPKYTKNIMRIDSPMIAMAKVCKKIYPQHKIVFISPCEFKKIEAKKSGIIDYCIDLVELKKLFGKYKIKERKIKKKVYFDGLYNEYTRVYPLAGGLSKTAHLKGILKEDESKKIDGIAEVIRFLKKPDKKIKFLDATYCIGGCIGGQYLTKDLTLMEKRERVMKYFKKAEKETIPKSRQGIFIKAKGINFKY
jgi:iron only hydrogenase large subunit-like protein